MAKVSGNNHSKADMNNHANQLNPNSAANKAVRNNRSNQMNPNNPNYKGVNGKSGK